MKVWQWFCRLGAYKKTDLVFGRVRYRENIAAPCKIGPSGVESVCTRLSGNAGCQCGSTMRGLHCIWSYYRIN